MGQGGNDDAKVLLVASALTLGSTLAGEAQADQLKIAFISHSSSSNTFWQAVKKGFEDACGKV